MTDKKVVVGSTNPVKVDAAREAFQAMFPDVTFHVVGVKAQSGVADQPMSSAETWQGAKNRVEHAQEIDPVADYWIAFEGGVEDDGTRMRSVVWVMALDPTGLMGEGRAAGFVVPQKVADLIRSGVEMGVADDQVFARENSKQSNGAIGLLTHDVRTRTSVYADGAIMALIPFKNPTLYKVAV